MLEATHRPSKVAAAKYFSPVSMLLIQAVTMFTIPCDSQKTLFFYKFHCYFEVFSATMLFRNSRPEVIYKKDFLKHFAKFAGKHLCRTLFFKNLQVSGL